MQTRTETKLGQEPETETNHRVREKKKKLREMQVS